jgi:hypothetical protein
MSQPERIVYVERARGNGCLWGCLGVAMIVALPLIVAWGYGTWFLWHGFRESPMVRAAIAMTEHDGLAQRVLGSPITITGVEGNAFTFATGVGARSSYVLRLEGPRGQGTLAVTSHTEGRNAKIDALALTGPDGRQYDLLHHAPVPGDGGGGGDTQPI